jgi:hypothetical protein
MRGTQLR